MEALLSLAFDNLSSYDGPKIRKGMRQVEGLLAQICLSGSRPSDSRKNNDAHDGDDDDSAPLRKELGQLSQDPAFREFFKLQEGFEWNVAMRLIGTLDRLMAKGSDGQNDLLILSALDLIQGVLLLHPPSKTLFSREQNMNVRETMAHCLQITSTSIANEPTCSSSLTYSNPSTARPSSPPPCSPSSSPSSTHPSTPEPLRTSTVC